MQNFELEMRRETQTHCFNLKYFPELGANVLSENLNETFP